MKRVFPSIAASARALPKAVPAAVLAVLAGPVEVRAAAAPQETALTIYSAARPGGVPAEYYRPTPGRSSPSAADVPGFAMVRDDRRMRVEAGRSTLRFTDVAALIDPTTVTFTSLSDPATRVVEQNFQFDLVSTEKLTQRFVDRPVTVERGPNRFGRRIQRKGRRQLLDLTPHRGKSGLIGATERPVDQLRHLPHLRHAHSPRRHRRGAQSDAAGDEWRLGIVGDGVLIHRYPRVTQDFLRRLPG